jgi:hypothetical protein
MHGPNDIDGRFGLDDHGRPLVDIEVPRLTRRVIAAVPDDVDVAREEEPQRVQTRG